MRTADRILDRRHEPLTLDHLKLFASWAQDEHEAFFRRRPHQRARYADRFLFAALCQGAGLHFVNGTNGVKDIDFYQFYHQHPEHRMMSRGPFSRNRDVPGFGVRTVDWLRTVVPDAFVKTDISELVSGFLSAPPTANAKHLRKKAVVGLVPEDIFGRVLWQCEEA
jgi:hypothetical protein